MPPARFPPPRARRRFGAVSLVVLCLAVAAACGDGPSAPWITVEASDVAPLAARVEVELEEPGSIRLRAESDDHEVVTPWTAQTSDHHELALAGLRADTDYRVHVEVEGSDGPTGVAEAGHTTVAYPDTLPTLEVAVAESARMSPGVTMLDVGSWGVDGDRGRTGGGLVMLDEEGEIVWFIEDFFTIGDATLTERGTILFNFPPFGIREIDLLGNVVAQYELDEEIEEGATSVRSPDPGRGTFHHVANPLANGNVMTLGERVVSLDEDEMEAICPGFTQPFELIDNTVIEFAPDGEVVHQWAVTDIIDPADHPGAEACAPEGGLRDWLHGNAAVLDEEHNQVVVSGRHIDLIFAFRYEDDDEGPSGELLWSLGPTGTLDLRSGDYSYHPHAPELGPDGELLVYDNGNTRPTTSETDPSMPAYSRAVAYRLDLDAGIATQTWEHRVDDWVRNGPLYAAFLGDADRLENGNVLIDHGGIDRDHPPARGRLIEVVPEGSAGGDIVFDVRLPGPWVSYRAERLPTLYVGPTWR